MKQNELNKLRAPHSSQPTQPTRVWAQPRPELPRNAQPQNCQLQKLLLSEPTSFQVVNYAANTICWKKSGDFQDWFWGLRFGANWSISKNLLRSESRILSRWEGIQKILSRGRVKIAIFKNGSRQNSLVQEIEICAQVGSLRTVTLKLLVPVWPAIPFSVLWIQKWRTPAGT